MPFVTSTVLVGASVAMSAVGAYSSAQAGKSSAAYNAQVQRNNAQIAEENAADIRKRGEQAAQDKGAQVRQVIGATRAAMAGNGLLVDDAAGTTSAQLLDDLMTAGAVDITRMRENAAREEYRALVQGANFEAQAGLFDLKAKSINPMLAGFSAGLSGAVQGANVLFPN